MTEALHLKMLAVIMVNNEDHTKASITQFLREVL